jgi:hypothetical protein
MSQVPSTCKGMGSHLDVNARRKRIVGHLRLYAAENNTKIKRQVVLINSQGK